MLAGQRLREPPIWVGRLMVTMWDKRVPPLSGPESEHPGSGALSRPSKVYASFFQEIKRYDDGGTVAQPVAWHGVDLNTVKMGQIVAPLGAAGKPSRMKTWLGFSH